jgi:hypothetical protein
LTFNRAGSQLLPQQGTVYSTLNRTHILGWDYATLRAFVSVFRRARGFSRYATVVVLALGAALSGDDNSGLGGFDMRWWPWFRRWMRTVSSCERS